MRASYGSLQLLGLKPGGYPFSPKAVFLLIGDICAGGCMFCPQSAGNPEKLSRVTWPKTNESDVIKAIAKTKLDRICIQATKSSEAKPYAISLLEDIRKVTITPVSVSMHIETVQDAVELFDAGAGNISIALDTANDALSMEMKNKPLQPSVNMLIHLAGIYPGQITTHLIAGLGETQEEIIELGRKLVRANVCVSLFAFTPIPGTLLEKRPQPNLAIYRQIQAALAMIRRKHDWEIKYRNGCIVDLGDYKSLLAPSDFQNPGCRGCNRPYYNEKPGGTIYNHPNPPEMQTILKEICL